MKMALQIAAGIIMAAVVIFVGKLLFWGWFLTALSDAFKEEVPKTVQSVQREVRRMEPKPVYRVVTERVRPQSLRKCQEIYGEEINNTVRSCMEGSVLTIQINNNTGERKILKREKYYHIDKQNVM